jgi:hypothetical protein
MAAYDRVKWWDGAAWRPSAAPVAAAFNVAGSAATATVMTSVPASTNGDTAFTVSGTVKTLAGANVTNGTVQVQYYSGSWINSGAAVAVSAGAWSRTGNTEAASRSWRAVYTPGAGNLASTSASKTVVRKVLTTFVKNYAPSWAASYQGDGDKRATDELHQGQFDSTNGNQRSLIGFPATIQSDLSGATVTKVELWLYAIHWGPDSGGTASIGYHILTSEPATHTGASAAEDEVRVAWSTKSGGKWCNITAMADDWPSTTHGVVVGPGPSTALEYYGYFRGPNQSSPPLLKITYTKWV